MSLYCPALARAKARVMVPRPARIPYARTKPLLKPSHAGLQILSAVTHTAECHVRHAHTAGVIVQHLLMQTPLLVQTGLHETGFLQKLVV